MPIKTYFGKLIMTKQKHWHCSLVRFLLPKEKIRGIFEEKTLFDSKLAINLDVETILKKTQWPRHK